MKRLGYGLGVLLLVFAAATGVAHLLAFFSAANAPPVTLGSLWYSISPNSLVGLQALVEKRLSPGLWQPILWLLLLPTWVTLGVPGLALLILCRPRARGFD
jgi:hypothetical protein